MSVNSKMTAIADAIRKQSGKTDALTLDGMAAEIHDFHTFTPPGSDGMTPEDVYRTTRPCDWLPMPIPEDDEIYLLNLIPEGLDGAFTAKINVTGTCTVEFGNLINGVFAAKETITPSRNVRFYHTVSWNDYGDTTPDGYRQYLVRIKGDYTQAIFCYQDNEVYSYGVPFLVDAIIGKTADIRFSLSNEKGYACQELRYVRFVGNGSLPNANGSMNFWACAGLISVSSEKEFPSMPMNYMFMNCKSLTAISENILPSECDYHETFRGSVIKALPKKIIEPTAVKAMFRDTLSPMVIDGAYLDTNRITDFTYFCYSSYVTSIRNLNISSAANFQSAFSSSLLKEITFAGDTTPGGCTINLSSLYLSHKALVNMINSLPTATNAAIITVTDNPGTPELSDAEIAVAAAKNWTLTI